MATAFQEYVECPICMNLLQPPEHEPLILVCLHTICSKCFDKIRSDANVQCPFCNSLCDNTMVKKDFRTASLVDAFLKASNRYPGARTSVASQVGLLCIGITAKKSIYMYFIYGHLEHISKSPRHVSEKKCL